MLDWLKNLLSRNPIKNLAGMPDPPLDLLRTDLKALDNTYAGLGDVILAYVLDGENEEILLHLRGLKDAAGLLRLRYTDGGGRQGRSRERHSVFNLADKIPPIVLYRLGRVYEAIWSAAPNASWHWPHLLPDERWLDALLGEILEMNPRGYSYTPRGEKGFDVEILARVCEAGGHPTSLPAKLILFEEPSYSYGHFRPVTLERLTNLPAYLTSEPEMVLRGLEHEKSPHRAHVLDMLASQNVPLNDTLATRIVALAVDESKTARQAAEKLLVAQKDGARAQVIQAIREKAANGVLAERTNAVGLLSRMEGAGSAEFLRARLAVETGKKTLAELEKYLGMQTTGGDGDGETYQDGLEAPTPATFPTDYVLSPEIEKDLVAVVAAFGQNAVAEHAKQWDRTPEKWRRGSRDMASPTNAKMGTNAFQALQSADMIKKGALPLTVKGWSHLLVRALGEFVQRQNLELVPLIRLGVICGHIGAPNDKGGHLHQRVNDDPVEWISGAIQRRYPNLTLLDLSAAFEAAGLGAAWVEDLYGTYRWGSVFNFFHLPNDAIWPFFLIHREQLKIALGLTAIPPNRLPYYWIDRDRKAAFQVLATFPKPPSEFAPFLWECALGGSKADRPLAQACLKNYPNREKLIIRALEDGRKEMRASAAEWLGQLQAKEAIAPIKKALASEKQDEARAAMMEALERLGEDIDQFLNRKKLLEDAKKAVAQKVPKELEWFPFDALPEVHWEKNKQLVQPEIIRWFVLQAFKLKKAEPGPLQRRYFAMMREDERRTLGGFILNAWLTQDTLPRYNQAEAEAEADKSAAQIAQYAKSHPQYYPNFSEAQTRKQYLGQYLNECRGSASDSRGVLAIAAACCGPEVVPKAEKYIRFWYGRRMTQAKSLIQMLSWIDHPLPIQLILAVGTRFRTKALQKEAGVCADRLADRKGWTRDEMADRTIPNAGFNRDGTQVIDYGMRTFTAKLMEDYSIELKNEEGKVISALPDALKSENEEEVKELKKDFSASKKELKQVLKLQEERLYEAMCTQRRWRYDEWESYLNAHPIVGRFCQQLVWLAFRGDQLAASFRPLPDGSLSDYDDNAVSLEPSDQIQVAHQMVLSSDDVAKWQQHLADYEVKSLFAQFGKKQFASTLDLSKTSEIKEFEGYLVNSFRLRSRTGKLGYVRGSAEDGGWFFLYLKSLPGLKLQAVIEFTGNTLPEEDRMVALRQLYFVRMSETGSEGSSYSHRPIKLSEVPSVMLMECWNDMKTIADDGSGFDKDWEKRSAY